MVKPQDVCRLAREHQTLIKTVLSLFVFKKFAFLCFDSRFVAVVDHVSCNFVAFLNDLFIDSCVVLCVQ